MNEPSECSEPGEARSRLSHRHRALSRRCAVRAAGVEAEAATTPHPRRRALGRAVATPDAGEARPAARARPPNLRVTSDVAGAFVFVDRKFLGKTPLETDDVQAGSHRLQVSAEGYDGVSQSIEVARRRSDRCLGVAEDSRRSTRACRSCTSTASDRARARSSPTCAGFATRRRTGTTPGRCPSVTSRSLCLDYQGKTLQIKQRGGRTWNFTTRTSNADPLLVFQREVDHARSRLARKPGMSGAVGMASRRHRRLGRDARAAHCRLAFTSSRRRARLGQTPRLRSR